LEKEEEEKKGIPLIGDAGFAHFFYLATFLLKNPPCYKKK
jgi:hypothetical protein